MHHVHLPWVTKNVGTNKKIPRRDAKPKIRRQELNLEAASQNNWYDCNFTDFKKTPTCTECQEQLKNW